MEKYWLNCISIIVKFYVNDTKKKSSLQIKLHASIHIGPLYTTKHFEYRV